MQVNPGTPDPLAAGETSRRTPNWLIPSTFSAFKQYLLEQRRTSAEDVRAFAEVRPTQLYELARLLRIPEDQLTGYLARFLHLPVVRRFDSEELSLSLLPRSFCASNQIVPLADGTVVVTNPFDWALMEVLANSLWRSEPPRIALGDPARVRALYEVEEEAPDTDAVGARVISFDDEADRGQEATASAQRLANELLSGALAERASDLHIEPKERGALIRYRIDGDLHDIRTVDPKASARLISRLKALAGMDIAEKRKPQDGGLEVRLGARRLRLRLATSATGHGETLVVRILEPDRDPVPLEDLGMRPEQARDLHELASSEQGMILVVGPTGSGKSTTIFTLLSNVDARSRSLMSVEDPVEYRIPYANQQQVNVKAGVTFDALLRSAVRQDPDILFLGEVRDSFSARAVLDFASSGHLTISSMHSSNATTAIFRLERLGVERSAMADSISAIIAQKLLKKLCPECRDVGPPTPEEAEILRDFTDAMPDRVARPVGCPACRETGYWGREGVYEILRMDLDVSRLVRDGRGIAAIRAFCEARGDYLISDHAISKIRELTIAVQDAHEQVLVEEHRYRTPEEVGTATGANPADDPVPSQRPVPDGLQDDPSALRPHDTAAGCVLVVDDDPDMRALIENHLGGAGYDVVLAEDGIEALLKLGQGRFVAVVSDVNMPNLDGVKLMEMIGQKGLSVPAVFLTGVEDETTEDQILGLGAADYIRKPVRKEVLLMRLRNAIRKAAPALDAAGSP
jgi:type II secretory ATPase GspE/PulE/Tfp pilus assembly ATPase PilB-like protein/CheY-like chemotaxis protein